MAQKYNYFDALAQMADYSCQAAVCFEDFMNDFNPALLPRAIEEMHKIEHRADDKRFEILSKLAKEFLSPIERGDIIDLTAKLDDITDSIDDTMQHLFIYNVQKLLPECQEFAVLIGKCCKAVKEIAEEFGNFHKSSIIHDKIKAVHLLESEGDLLYSKAMRDLHTSKMDNKDIFIWTRLITSFEECCDHCEEAAELFESAIMKNS